MDEFFLEGLSLEQQKAIGKQADSIRTAAQQQAAAQLAFNRGQLGAYGIAAGLGAAVGGGLGGLIGGEEGGTVGAIGGTITAPAMAYGANALLQKYLAQNIAASAIDQAFDDAYNEAYAPAIVKGQPEGATIMGPSTPIVKEASGFVPVKLDAKTRADALLDEYTKAAIAQQELAKVAQSAAIQGGAAVAPLTAGYQLIRNRFFR